MDLLIISNYWHFECEKKSSRYLSIANLAAGNGIDVEVVTSKFYHTKKKHRTLSDETLGKYSFRTTMVDEPGYKKNIDPRRITSHNKFAKNVIGYLKTRKKPDLIYLFVPSLSLGTRVVKFANDNEIPIIIDVLDLWPEAFGMLSPFPKLTLKFLHRMNKQANYIYENADGVVAVSDTYKNRVMSVNRKCREALSVYIGIDLKVFDACIKACEKNDEVIDIAYIGMLGKSYDLKCAIDAIHILNQQGLNNLRFVVMGDGPLKDEFERYAKEKEINSVFTGRLPYEDMVSRLASCDIALNVISRGSVASIINKHADYLAAGLPIVNNQGVAEFGELLSAYDCGFNCRNSDPLSLAQAIKKLAESKELRVMMGQRARALAEAKFDRNNTYKEILGYMENVRI